MKYEIVCKRCLKPLPGPTTPEHQHIVSQCKEKKCPYKGNLPRSS